MDEKTLSVMHAVDSLTEIKKEINKRAACELETDIIQIESAISQHRKKMRGVLPGCTGAVVFPGISANNPHTTQRHLQPCGTVLQAPGESLPKGRNHGKEESAGNAVLDEGGIPPIRKSDPG